MVPLIVDSVDEGGHSSYWGSDIYYEMVAEKDRQVAGILQALEDTRTESGKLRLLVVVSRRFLK